MNALKAYSVLILPVVTLLTFAYEASAWNEPSGFKGVPFGSSEETLKEKIRATCSNLSKPPLPERSCSASLEIGGVAVLATFTLRSGALVGISLKFDSQNFNTIEDIFIERYGTPTAQEDNQVQTRMGATLVNRRDVWDGKLVYITLGRFSNEITQSHALLITKAEMKYGLDSFHEEKKKSAKDLD